MVLARTDLGRAERVVLAGHLDTVPIADNVPSRARRATVLYGCGTSDMKSGRRGAAAGGAPASAPGRCDPRVDLTWVFYDCEEVEAARNGLGRLARERPDALAGDLAILLEPTDGVVEGGCQGTLRVVVRGDRACAHTARGRGSASNAIHAAAPVLQRLADYEAREVDVDGLAYREGLNAVGISGGVAGNVVPDECTVTVNYRFAPDRVRGRGAGARARGVRRAIDVDASSTRRRPPGPGSTRALPQLDRRRGRRAGRGPSYGWTDVARFGELGIPAVNFGPGRPEPGAQARTSTCRWPRCGLPRTRSSASCRE